MKNLNLNINNLVLTVVRMVINTLCINRTKESGYANIRLVLVRS